MGMKNISKNFIFEEKKGFTLIELLIVIAVTAILMSVVFVALNPLARFQEARNNTRWSDVEAILSAIKLHQVDNKGSYLPALDNLKVGSEYMIGTGEDGCGAYSAACNAVNLQTDCVDLTGLKTAGYLPDVPIDKKANSDATEEFTFYYLMKHDNGAITVGACNPEKGLADSVPSIYVKR